MLGRSSVGRVRASDSTSDAGLQARRMGHDTITILVEAICFVKAEFHHLAYTAFKLTILLPQVGCWEYRPVSPHLTTDTILSFFFFFL